MNLLDFEVKRSKVKVIMKPDMAKSYLFENALYWQRHTGCHC